MIFPSHFYFFPTLNNVFSICYVVDTQMVWISLQALSVHTGIHICLCVCFRFETAGPVLAEASLEEQ